MHPRFAALTTAGAAALLLAACGGSDRYVPTTAGLSDTQIAFEESALAANGGLHTVSYGFGIGTGGFGQVTAVAHSSLSLPDNPAGQPAGVMAAYTPAQDLLASMPTPALLKESNPNVGTAVIEGGQVQFYSTLTPPRVTYVGDDVELKYTTTAGAVGTTLRIKAIKGVDLFGTIADMPAELGTLYGILAPYGRPGTVFTVGSRGFITTMQRAEQLTVVDADDDPETNPKSATAVFVGTIEQFQLAWPGEIGLDRGTIRTVKGSRCWVNNRDGVTDAPMPTLITYRVQPAYGAFCEIGGRVYKASWTPDGAVVGSLYPPAVGGQLVRRLPYVFRFNKLAADSFAAMLK